MKKIFLCSLIICCLLMVGCGNDDNTISVDVDGDEVNVDLPGIDVDVDGEDVNVDMPGMDVDIDN